MTRRFDDLTLAQLALVEHLSLRLSGRAKTMLDALRAAGALQPHTQSALDSEAARYDRTARWARAALERKSPLNPIYSNRNRHKNAKRAASAGASCAKESVSAMSTIPVHHRSASPRTDR